jgi:AcrR family transcriptional regulator
MGRPKLHDEDSILDAAESLLAEGGRERLTVRALSARTGAPTGSLYHAFGSRTELLGQLWLRAAELFLDRLEEEMNRALAGQEPDRGTRALLAASRTLALIQAERPNTAALLFAQSREALLSEGLPKELQESLRALDQRLSGAIRSLAKATLGRTDEAAICVVAICIVELPTALLTGRRRPGIDREEILEGAIEGVLAHEELRRHKGGSRGIGAHA